MSKDWIYNLIISRICIRELFEWLQLVLSVENTVVRSLLVIFMVFLHLTVIKFHYLILANIVLIFNNNVGVCRRNINIANKYNYVKLLNPY